MSTTPVSVVDHEKLLNIGTKTHAELDAYLNAPSYIYTKTMTGNEVFTPPGRMFMVAILDGNGADRTFNPSGSFETGFIIELWNVGNYPITFDSSVLGVEIGIGQVGRFIYSGTAFFGKSI